MTVWRLQTVTKGNGKHHVADYLIREKIIGCGWGINEQKNKKIKNFLEYEKAAKLEYSQGIPAAALTLNNKILAGDYVWIHSEGVYYIGKVEEESRWVYWTDADELDIHNVRTHITWYPACSLRNSLKKMADESDVPGAITTSFIRGRTIQRINKEGIQEYSDWVYSKVSGEKMKTEKIKLTENKFFSYLGTEQLEDLTYIWLYDKYGYIVIPSTNKKGTQLYEFVLLNPKKEKLTKAYLQVKLGEVTLDSKKYRNLDGIVYLVTTQGEILNSDNTDNVCIIKSKELYEFAKNRNNWYVLPQSITSWFEME